MEFSELLVLPYKNPVIIFMIVLLVILLSPIILKKFKIPGLVGLIISGMLLGPNGFYILERDSSIILFGTVGLLYIMFLAGLELDYHAFRKNRKKSIIFGFLTFIIPLTGGYLFCLFILKLNHTASILIATMFSTQTLVSYPIISRLGILKNDIVGIAVGGTIFTDSAVLIILSVIVRSVQGSLSIDFWFDLIISSAIFIFIVIYLFPKLAKWFFKNIEPESVWQYIFVLLLLFTSAFLSELAGIEPIIGAFIAGLALNRLLPSNSALMDKIDFVGNAIFIPFFLISVGMIVDLSVIVTGWETILFVCTITSVAIITKWVAAYIFGKIYKLTKIQYSLLFGLSSAHAAATLAIIFVGVRIGIVDSSILNATVVLILITCIVSSFVTENYGRKVALTIQNAPYQIYEKIQRILVPISNPNNIKNLMEFGLFIKDIYSKEFITSLMVFDKEYDIEAKVTNCRMVLDRVIKEISPNLMNQVQIASRIDISPSSGILRAIKELLISDIVIGLSEKHLISDFIFGSIAENLVSETNQCIYIVKITYPLNTNEKIFIFLAANAELEEGFENLIVTLSRLCINIGAICVFCCFERTSAAIRHTLKFHKIIMTASFETAANIEEFDKFKSWIQEDDMICFINSRFKGISYDSIYDNFLHKVAAEFQNNNFAIIYPEQSPVIRTESYTKYDIMDSSAVGESMKLVETIKKWFAIIKVN